MICLYDKFADTFTDNGICVLDPSVCTVSEEAAGSYELYLEHPFDKNEKYQMIAEDMIIRAPIPHTVIPSVTLPETTIYTVNTVGTFWKVMPVPKRTADVQASVDYIRGLPSGYTWSQYKGFGEGSFCVYSGVIYKCIRHVVGGSGASTPAQDPESWVRVGTVSGTQPEDAKYTPGEEYSPALQVGQQVRKIATYSDSFVQIRDNLGRVGYYGIEMLTETTTEAEVIPQQTIDEQLFRVYSLDSDEETHILKVYARHISYDFKGNALMDCKLEETQVNDAIAVIQGNLMIHDDRRIACEFEDNKITRDWSYKNPINVLLDPDDGLVPELKARLIRNNADFFILKNDTPRTGITIEYGVNMTGVNWNRNVETSISRVVPRCSDKADGYVYLEHGGTWDSEGVWVQNDDIYIDSPYADTFPYAKIEVMDMGFSVGDKYTPAGQKNEIERTLASCREEMLKQAQERFTKDRCDAPEITLSVQFCLMGDTVQYRQYRGLQFVNLYDKITIKTKCYEVTAQVTRYEFDCLKKRYNSIDVGEVNTFNKRVPGYKVVNESITYAKLSPDLISRIRTMNAPSGATTGSGGGGTPSGGYDNNTTIPINSLNDDGLVSKGTGNASKVWKTDENGNPGWRQEANAINVIDNLASTSAVDALSANQGRVLNESKVSGASLELGNGETKSITLPTNCVFMAFLSRTNKGSTTAEGVYYGSTGGTSGHLTLITPSAPTSFIINISGSTLTMTASASNLIITFIWLKNS